MRKRNEAGVFKVSGEPFDQALQSDKPVMPPATGLACRHRNMDRDWTEQR